MADAVAHNGAGGELVNRLQDIGMQVEALRIAAAAGELSDKEAQGS